jgi:hypothetical protein
MRSGASMSISPEAHMRRGKGTGGRKPPRPGWPSTPMAARTGVSRK